MGSLRSQKTRNWGLAYRGYCILDFHIPITIWYPNFTLQESNQHHLENFFLHAMQQILLWNRCIIVVASFGTSSVVRFYAWSGKIRLIRSTSNMFFCSPRYSKLLISIHEISSISKMAVGKTMSPRDIQWDRSCHSVVVPVTDCMVSSPLSLFEKTKAEGRPLYVSGPMVR